MANDPLSWLDRELARLEDHTLRRRLAIRSGPQQPQYILLDGQPLVNFGSNDYLGLAAEGLSPAVREALEQAGWGAGASPLVSGRGALHAALERDLAQFEGTEAALLFPTGFAANLSTIAALVGRRDVVFGDARNHASLIDGCRLSGAQFQVYPHRDMTALSKLLQQAFHFRRRLIVSDSLFSMDGDLAPLAELAELAGRHQVMLMVDEAHATGVLGARGRGGCEQAGVEEAVHVRVGTLSKALGSIGGFVAGQSRLIDWLANRARAYVFSTATPEPAAAAARQALRIVRDEPQRRRTLLQRSDQVRDKLQQQGWSTGASQGQIVPVMLGHPQRALDHATALRRRGLFVPAIRPPSVPLGQSLLRISLSWSHGEEQIDQLLDALGECR